MFKYTEVLEQTKAGEWRTVRRYDRKTKILVAGCVLAFLALFAVSIWGIYKFSQIEEPTEKVEEIKEVVVEEMPVEEKFAIPYIFEASPDAAGFDGEKWARIKKTDGTFAVYESLHEGNKELAEFSVSADIGAGTFTIRMGTKASDDIQISMTHADIERLKSFIEEGMRVVVE